MPQVWHGVSLRARRRLAWSRKTTTTSSPSTSGCDMDGMQVVRMMKVEGIDIPVMLLSGLADINQHFVAADLGVEKFLTKPFSANELIGQMEGIAKPGAAPAAAAAPPPQPAPPPRPVRRGAGPW